MREELVRGIWAQSVPQNSFFPGVEVGLDLWLAYYIPTS